MPRDVPLIDIPLTGERTYLFAADIFDALRGVSGAEVGMVLQLKSSGACALELLAQAPDPGDPDICGTFRYDTDARTERRWLRLRRDRPVAARIPFDDDAVVADATFAGDRARLPAGGSGTLMQRALFLALALLEQERPEDYWRLAEMVCTRRPPDGAALDATIRQRAGGRFWKVEMAADGAPFGHLILSRAPPSGSV